MKKRIIRAVLDEYTPAICQADDGRLTVAIHIEHETRDPQNPCRCYTVRIEDIGTRRDRLIRNLRKRLILDKVETVGFVTDEDLLKQTEGTFLRAIAEVDVLWLECCTAVLDFLARLLPPYRKRKQ